MELLTLPDERTLRVYDVGSGPPVFWHHGSPNTGEPPEPLLDAGVRWISYNRPGYPGSTRRPGRDVASAAADVAAIADALGLDRFALMGHSGGGPHVLACAALLPDRVTAAVSMSGQAPPDAAGLDWLDGLHDKDEIFAARRGRAALEDYLAKAEFDPEVFTPEDHAALSGRWSWLGRIVGAAMAEGDAGFVDDLLASQQPWGVDLAAIRCPVLFVHGGQDRMVPAAHGRWLAGQVRGSELWLKPEAGHLSVLDSTADALDWLRA
ncbi:alpha/beta fold hydrolase [Labedaea rhizosphaerae]|uniref:Pimeloyl-ACP methyl ester carboxylesterase n=1 Tax=Labedaea rhizosphaerae TaxID=598644 RepID=A0A4R6SIT4_LABRH|nr:alpha/beta hydrolase [Labedaea rhizosphaerae]TDQ01557.1 pimeloyl-ACP methyl ester carboxylesterase [Labedaea rhizosphaerae]